MKKNMLMSLGALALATAGVSAEAATVIPSGQLFQATLGLGEGADNLGVDLYYNKVFKINDTYTLTPEILTNVNFMSKGTSDVGGSFGFLRLVLSGPVLKQWSENRTFKLEYRYTAPLDMGSQVAGSYGVVGIRPVLAWNFTENLSFLGRAMTQVYLVRNGYNVNRPVTPKFNPSGYKGVAGNTVIATTPEFALEYAFGGKFTIYTLWVPIIGLKANAPGAKSVTWTKALTHQHAVTYAVNEALTIEVGAANESLPMNNLKLFSKSSNMFYVESQYKF